MRKTDKNEFLKIIQDFDLDISLFKKHEKEVDGNGAFIIQLINSPLFFMARTNNEDIFEHDCRYIKFAKKFPKTDYIPETISWWDINAILSEFRYWLQNHVVPYIDDLEAPDLWEMLDGKSLFKIDPFDNREDRLFTKTEKEKIKTSLEEFKRLINVEFSPTSKQNEVINDRLNYLVNRLDKLNKIDWQGIAISTVISISIALSLDTTKGKLLFNIFKQAFSSFIELLSK